MEEEWIGRSVSIQCNENLGVFQGVIRELSATQIKIVRAFRNGVPLRKQDAEIVINCGDIINLYILNTIPASLSDNSDGDTDEPSGACAASFKEPTSALTNKISTMKISSEQDAELRFSRQSSKPQSRPTSFTKSNGQKISPPSGKIRESKVSSFVDPQKLSPATDKFFKLVSNGSSNNMPPPPMIGHHRHHRPLGLNLGQNTVKIAPIEILTSNIPDEPDVVTALCRSSSKPIDISTLSKPVPINTIPSNNADGVVSTINGGKVIVCKPKKKYRRVADFNLLQTFGTPIDDSVMNEDFDFEGNLALFDKRAVWNTIEATRKPRPPKTTKKKSYRVDENILTSEPLDLRQISCGFQRAGDFVTDEGLIIPSIPLEIRSNIQKISAAAGLSIVRQNDFLARGTTEVALMLLGGSRRLTPNNRHQWPTIAIICDSKRTTEVGASTGRQIASHGLQVMMYVLKNSMDDPNERTGELELFKATGNKIVQTVSEIHSPDLVILSIMHKTVAPSVKKWLSITRASVLAIDPPTNGIEEITIKCSIFPILPLNHITLNCGKIFLCNLGIPDNFYREAGIVYKSPFGHKFVIQIYQKD